jgi:hypothetical protein
MYEPLTDEDMRSLTKISFDSPDRLTLRAVKEINYLRNRVKDLTMEQEGYFFGPVPAVGEPGLERLRQAFADHTQAVTACKHEENIYYDGVGYVCTNCWYHLGYRETTRDIKRDARPLPCHHTLVYSKTL